MSLKKMIALLAAVPFLFSSVYVSASTVSAIKYEVKDSFDDITEASDVSGGIRNWESDNTAGLSVVRGKNGTGICINNTNIRKALRGNLEKDEYYEISFDVYGDENSAVSMNFLDDAGKIKAQTTIGTGNFSIGSETDKYIDSAYTIRAGEWTSIKVKLSGYSAAVSLSVDGAEAAKNVIIPGLSSAAGIAGFEIADADDGEASISVDNVLTARMTDSGQVPSEINFSTDFEDMTMESRQLPEGFYPNSALLGSFKNIGMKQFDDGHGKAMKVVTSASMGAILSFRNVVKDKVTVSWQEYAESGTVPFIKVYDGSGADSVLKRYGHVYGGENKESTDFDKWVDVSAVIDAASGKVSLTYNGTTSEMTIGSLAKNGCSGLLFGGAPDSGYDKNSVCYDNLKVSSGATAGSGISVSRNIDFENYTVGGEYRNYMLQTSDGWYDPGASYVAFSKIIDTKNKEHNNAFYINLPTEKSPDYAGNVTAGLHMPQFVDSGVITFKVSVYIEDRNTPNFQVRSAETPAKENQLVYFDNNKGISFNTVSSGKWEPDKWYDIELTIDIDNNILSGKVTDEETGTEVASAEDISLGTVNIFDSFLFRTTNREPMNNKGVIVDDISIDYTAGTPYMRDVVFKADNQIVSDEPVSTLVDEICLEYNAALDGTSIADKVTLENQEGDKIKFIGYVSGNAYVIKPEAYLEASKHYTITVAQGVKSLTGEETETEQVYEFDTARGIKNAVIESVKIDNSDATLDKFVPNKEVSTSVRYINTENEETNMYIIYTYYFKNKKVDYVFEKYPMASDMQNLTLETVVSVPVDVPEFDEVRVFVWDGLKKMSPIADFMEIK